jgi:hypothetical protein
VFQAPLIGMNAERLLIAAEIADAKMVDEKAT